MTMNGAVIPVMAFYIVAALESGVKLEHLSGTIQARVPAPQKNRNSDNLDVIWT